MQVGHLASHCKNWRDASIMEPVPSATRPRQAVDPDSPAARPRHAVAYLSAKTSPHPANLTSRVAWLVWKLLGCTRTLSRI